MTFFQSYSGANSSAASQMDRIGERSSSSSSAITSGVFPFFQLCTNLPEEPLFFPDKLPFFSALLDPGRYASLIALLPQLTQGLFLIIFKDTHLYGLLPVF